MACLDTWLMAEGQELGRQELLPRQPFASAKLLSPSLSESHTSSDRSSAGLLGRRGRSDSLTPEIDKR